ncbi:MAG: AAA family ATPase [Solirubrobacteraceae bacterium]
MSAPTRDVAAAFAAPLRFVSAAELAASIPPEPPWLAGGYLAPGVVTLLAGKPKIGKSTLALAIGEAIDTNRSEFLGREVNGGAVVYLSEEGAATLVHKLPAGNLRLLTRDQALPRPDWPAAIDAARREAERVGARLLVADTFTFWGALPADAEKDAGAVAAALLPLFEAAADGLAVLLVTHTRKSGGEDGDAVRGSSALAGAADIVLELERPGGERTGRTARQRQLLALSRFPQTPGALLIEHGAAGGWAVVGESASREGAREIADRAALLAALDAGGELTRNDLETTTDIPARQWHGALEQLVADREVARHGAGKKGDPYRFTMLRTDSAQAAAQDAQKGAPVHPEVSSALPYGKEQKPQGATQQPPQTAQCAGTESPTDLEGVERDDFLADRGLTEDDLDELFARHAEDAEMREAWAGND